MQITWSPFSGEGTLFLFFAAAVAPHPSLSHKWKGRSATKQKNTFCGAVPQSYDQNFTVNLFFSFISFSFSSECIRTYNSNMFSPTSHVSKSFSRLRNLLSTVTLDLILFFPPIDPLLPSHHFHWYTNVCRVLVLQTQPVQKVIVVSFFGARVTLEGAACLPNF